MATTTQIITCDEASVLHQLATRITNGVWIQATFVRGFRSTTLLIYFRIHFLPEIGVSFATICLGYAGISQRNLRLLYSFSCSWKFNIRNEKIEIFNSQIYFFCHENCLQNSFLCINWPSYFQVFKYKIFIWKALSLKGAMWDIFNFYKMWIWKMNFLTLLILQSFF